MSDWEETLTSEDGKIRDAFETIDNSALQIALVVDDENCLIGTVTDGDVRRGLLNGYQMDDQVRKVMNTDPIVGSPSDSDDKLIRLMRDHSIHQIPIVNEDNQVQGLKTIEGALQEQQKKCSVVIMAGGLGTRLRPITEDIPKPMVEVNEKPILEHLIDDLVDSGFEDFFLSVNYKSDVIKDHFGDGSDLGIDISYLEEDSKLGTAGPLSLLPGGMTDPLLVLNSDLVTNINFENILNYHKQQADIATVCVREKNVDLPYGVIRVEDEEMVDYEEKPTEDFFINAGIYVFEPDVLNYIPENEKYDIDELFNALLRDEINPDMYLIHEYWQDVAREEDLEKVRDKFGSDQ